MGTSPAGSVAGSGASSTVAPHSSPRLQAELSYIRVKEDEMSSPASSIACASPRLAWCMSTTNEPAGYVAPATENAAGARSTSTSLSSRCAANRTAEGALSWPSPTGMTYARGKTVPQRSSSPKPGT